MDACLFACLLSPLLHSLMVLPTVGGSSLVSHQLRQSPSGTLWWFEWEWPPSAHVGILDSRLVELLGKDSEVWLWSVGGGMTFKVLKGLHHSESPSLLWLYLRMWVLSYCSSAMPTCLLPRCLPWWSWTVELWASNSVFYKLPCVLLPCVYHGVLQQEST